MESIANTAGHRGSCLRTVVSGILHCVPQSATVGSVGIRCLVRATFGTGTSDPQSQIYDNPVYHSLSEVAKLICLIFDTLAAVQAIIFHPKARDEIRSFPKEPPARAR